MASSIPPLNPLRTFEVAARLCSLTLAAEELNVSQVAVSRQVKTLEDYFGVTLFRRMHRGVELTEEGRQLYEGVTGAFQDIANASRRVCPGEAVATFWRSSPTPLFHSAG